MNNYMKRRWERRRLAAVDKLGGKCVNCGDRDELEFDHIDPATKLYSIARASSFSQSRFDAEVAKCQLLCRECHQEKHRPS
jgi:5-methylcytosine-specific restriction endonuclease McrA